MAENKEKLVVIWTSAHRDVAIMMVFMYVLNSKLNKWWDDITLIVWGPAANLLSQDFELQENIKIIKENGVTLEACLKCTDMYGITRKIADLGIDVKYMGIPLTDYIKEGRKIITF
ncbi:MAG: DsrE family protein [Actinobacteria bacterium]|nr:DsrE family protein [Actinomycetota bacterium]